MQQPASYASSALDLNQPPYSLLNLPPLVPICSPSAAHLRPSLPTPALSTLLCHPWNSCSLLALSASLRFPPLPYPYPYAYPYP